MKGWDEKQQILKMVLYQNFLFQNQSLHLSPFFYFPWLYNLHCTINIVHFTLYNLHCTIYIVQHKQGKNFEK